MGWAERRDTFLALGSYLRSLLSTQPYEILQVDAEAQNPGLDDELKEFEREFEYPLGEERMFRIIHGKGGGGYFGFYRTLGTPVVLVARNRGERRVVKPGEGGREVEHHCRENEIAAVGCGVLREMALPGGDRRMSVWYICDVKVGKKYRGDHLPLSMLRRKLWMSLRCPRGYFISMNSPAEGAPYGVRLWLRRTVFGRGSRRLLLNIYGLSAEACRSNRQRLEEACGGRLLFKSMEGKKDFEIFRRGGGGEREWRLLHIQHGPQGDTSVSPSVHDQPRDGHDHLIAAFSGSALDSALRAIEGVSPFGAATLVYYNLDPAIFGDTVMTNEI